MNKESAVKLSQSLISRADRVFMATLDTQADPEIRTMTNIHSASLYPVLSTQVANEPFNTYLPVSATSGKLVQIRRNNKGSLFYADSNSFESVLITGRFDLVTDEMQKNLFWQDGWTQYFPGGKNGGEYELLRFTARKFRYYDGKDTAYESNLEQ